MTVAADDYDVATRTSRNECPVWMRITACAMMDDPHRFKYMAAEPQFGGQGGFHVKGVRAKKVIVKKADPAQARRHEIWERIDENTFLHYRSFLRCAKAHGVLDPNLHKAKKIAIMNKNATCFFHFKDLELWWIDPREVNPAAVILEYILPTSPSDE